MLYMKMMMSYFESLVKLLIAAMFVMAIASGSAFASENADEPATDPAPVVEVVKEAPAAEPVAEVKAEPVAETPAPAAETPAPAVETPAPAADPAPVAETPAPAAEPAASAAEPAAEVVSEPVAETPAVEAPVAEPAAEAPAAEPEAAAPVAKEAAAEATAPAAAAATTEVPKAATKTQAAKTAKTAKSETVLKTAAAATPSLTRADGTSIDAVGGIYTINESGTYTFEGTTTDSIRIGSGSGAIDVTLNLIGAIINATNGSAIAITNNATATLNIFGNCEFTGALNGAGIEVNDGSTLKMYAGAEGASVRAVGNAGYDYKSNAEKTAAEKAGTYGSASGIGGTSESKGSGAIYIGDADGYRLQLSAIAGGQQAAGIGSTEGSAFTITIVNVDLGTVHGGCYNAEPEGKATESFKATLLGGAGIGVGTYGAGNTNITIENCAGEDIVGGGKSAGIGGSTWSGDVNITIRDSNLTVVGGSTGPAIGSGRPKNTTKLSVNISDSDIVAIGGMNGAGIGLGSDGSNYGLNPSFITISGGHTDAYGGYGAAGIGGGARGYNTNVNIVDGAIVNAYAGGAYASKYADLYNKALDLSTGLSGIGQSGAAGIGRGAWGSMNFYDQSTGSKIGTEKNPENIEINVKPSITISDDSVVSAFADGSTNAISGFVNTDGVESSILLVRFVRNYDLSGNHFLDKSWDNDMILANDGWYYCYLDVSKDTVLYIRDAETLKTLGSVVINAVDDDFANEYVGSNGERIGYYAVAITVPSAGNYKLYTTSDVRNSDDAELSQGSEGYLGGVSYRVNDETRSDIFSVEKGLNVFDWAAFRDEVDPEPEPESKPDPETPGTTETDPTTPTNPTDDPENETVVPTPATDPTDPEEETTTDVDPTPADDPAETPVDEPTVNTVTTPNAVTPIVAGGVPLAFAAIPAATTPATAAIPDDATPLAPATEAIEDEGTPMGAFDSEDENCWVHWWIMLGMALTALYGAAVAFRRQRNSSNLQKMDDEVMGKEEESVEAAAPTMAPQPAL